MFWIFSFTPFLRWRAVALADLRLGFPPEMHFYLREITLQLREIISISIDKLKFREITRNFDLISQNYAELRPVWEILISRNFKLVYTSCCTTKVRFSENDWNIFTKPNLRAPILGVIESDMSWTFSRVVCHTAGDIFRPHPSSLYTFIDTVFPIPSPVLQINLLNLHTFLLNTNRYIYTSPHIFLIYRYTLFLHL